MTGRGRAVVVGGGILGTMHALYALDLGFEVVQLERDLEPRGASVRNFGLVWVGGRAKGAELELALRARGQWEEIAGRVDGLHFRPAGSLTVAFEEPELALMKQACEGHDAGLRGWELLDGAAARELNPELPGGVLGALYCSTDAIVEPRLTVGILREHLSRQPGYEWMPGRTAVELSGGAVKDDRGEWHHGDRVFLCTGAAHSGLVAVYCPEPRTRRARLQMLETLPYAGRLTTAIADGDSMRYYPAFDLPGRDGLGPRAERAAAVGAQLLMVQRVDGTLTIGDTHEYAEPFAFDVQEDIYDYLLGCAARHLRGPLPPVRRRWAGVYGEVLSPDNGLYWREELLHGVEIVSGPGGRGMTCAPAIAQDSFTTLVGAS